MNVFEKEFDVILDKAKSLSKPMRVVVAGADAEHLLQAVFEAEARGFAIPVLVGNEDRIRTMLKELKLEDRKYEICGVVADDNVVQDAIDVVRNGGGDVLMRGNTSTRGFLMPLLNKGNKLIKNDVLTYVSLMKLPHYDRLLALSDAKQQAFYGRHIGKEAVVLLEKPKAGQPFHGFTDNYIRVEMADPAARDNALVRVRLGGFNEEGTALVGEIV